MNSQKAATTTRGATSCRASVQYLVVTLVLVAFGCVFACRRGSEPKEDPLNRDAAGQVHVSAVQGTAKAVIRIGYPGVGIGGRPYIGGNIAAAVHGKRALESEFERDGIAIDWSLNKGAGPAVNELIAGRQLDLAYLGDLAAIIGRSIGLDTKIVAAGGRGGNLYLVVRHNSSFHSLNDLRGKRVVVFKGTALQLQAVRILEQRGYAESDFKTITMDQATGIAAILGGDVDALWAQFPILEYVEKGDVRVVASSREPAPDKTPSATAFGVLLATGEFERQHADWVQRVVSVFVKESDWGSEDKHRDELYNLWSRAGYPKVVFEKDGHDLSRRLSPLLDAQFIGEVKTGADAALKFGLIRKAIDVPGWFESKYIEHALKDLKLEQRWFGSRE